MKVKELIDELRKYPADMRIILCGYEEGYVDLQIIKLTEIELNVNKESYYGPHDDVDELNNHKADEVALLLS